MMSKNALCGWTGLCLVACALCGCVTRYVAVPERHVRDSVAVRCERDSVFVHDSVFVREYVRGDTVCQFRDRTKMVYRDRIVHDTVAVARRDSVPYIVEKKTVEYRYMTRWYDRVCRCVAAFALLAMLAWLAWRKMRR